MDALDREIEDILSQLKESPSFTTTRQGRKGTSVIWTVAVATCCRLSVSLVVCRNLGDF